MVFLLLSPGFALASESKDIHTEINQKKVSRHLLNEFNKDEKVTFLIKFKDKANFPAENETSHLQEKESMHRNEVIDELKTTSADSQEDVIEYLEEQAEIGNAGDIESYYIVNGVAVTATKEVADEIGTFEEVEKILPNETRYLHETSRDNTEATTELSEVEWNVERVGASNVWAQGFDGDGVVVASVDSGVDWKHPALQNKYRGFDTTTGQVDHRYNWFDAVNGKSVPYDDRGGHGTHVTGTMVGSEPDGSNQIGVAPTAEWIAIKAFDATGAATDADLLEAAEWILAPTDEQGNERPDLAPDIVNNSWGGGKGLDEWYRDVVKAWVAAGIFPVFSAGNTSWSNTGGPGSIEVPANYPESFAVGATDRNNRLASFSLLGPSPYNEIKPDITAPGTKIRSSLPGGGYGVMSGTSMAGPAIAGVAALLYQASPNLTVEQMKTIMKNSATPLTDAGYPESPNNGYGYGLVNAEKATELALAEERKKVKRIAGYSRYDTAIEVSRSGWETTDTVILARGNNYADALAGVPLASKLDAPILLTTSDKLFERTFREIKRLRAQEVIILGGPVAINEKISEELEREDIKVRRISGHSRLDTAAKIASEVSPEGTDQVILANGYNFPDALSVASHAAREGIPILLTEEDELSESTIRAIDLLAVKETIIVGGSLVVNDTILKKVPNGIRLSGRDRYDTNIEVATYFGEDADQQYIATGKNYADALTGAVLAAKNNSQILLVHHIIPENTSNYIRNTMVEGLTIFGGPIAVNEDIEKQLKKLLDE